MANGSDVIVKGGSVEIIFDETVYPKTNGSFKSNAKKITGITIRDNATGQEQVLSAPSGGDCTIIVNCA